MLRTQPRRLVAVLPVLFLTAFTLAAQDQTIPLQNWAAPLYWQPPAPQESLKAAATQPREAAVYTRPLVFVGLTPCRVLDTRNAVGSFGGPPLAAGETRVFPIPSSSCGVPGNASAYSFNVTVVPFGPLGYLGMWPTGQAQPTVSTLNALSGQVTANAAIVPAGTNGSVNIYVTDSTNVIVDVNGYYMPPSALALGAGTAAAPALTFSNDTNSGSYSPSAGTVKVTSSGADRLTVDASGVSVAGNVNMTGDLQKSGTRLVGATGFSTRLGLSALNSLTSGTDNTAVGHQSMYSMLTGANNTAVGKISLYSNTAGSQNVVMGDQAFFSNVSGINNTALGYSAGFGNTGSDNTLIGNNAGQGNGAANYNTVAGSAAGWSITTGGSNAMLGYQAGYKNTTASRNALVGYKAGYNNAVGGYNTMVGESAGYNATGSWNTLIGYSSGYYDTTGDDNIRINNFGVAGESNTARYGGTFISRSFMAGVRGVTTGLANATAVIIDSNGQLGTINSSRTVKRDIRDMGDTTATIMGLRPVRFRYTTHDPDSPEQYGLIAEEVAEVAPDLVARKENGDIETVYYHKVDAMLLNEVQKQHKLIQAQSAIIRQLESRLTALESHPE